MFPLNLKGYKRQGDGALNALLLEQVILAWLLLRTELEEDITQCSFSQQFDGHRMTIIKWNGLCHNLDVTNPSHSMSIKGELKAYWQNNERHKYHGISTLLGELVRIVKRI